MPQLNEHTRPVSRFTASAPLPCVSLTGAQPPEIVTVGVPCFDSGNSIAPSSGTVCVSATFST
ncbi:Uncharacterised protein [Burkholderia pseudomallei]|nr:Uncharacterised protein [Burkholderia pseudomallei]